jgi:hypothetical protein
MRLDRRLERLARQMGCPTHGELLLCPVCDPLPPLPAELDVALHELVNAIVARVDRETLRATCLRVPRPPRCEPCPRCGARRECVTCGAAYGQAMFQAIGLTAHEQAMVQDAVATCRALEAKRG